jgi:ankyrin repeat/SOCS box protein 13/metal transporter CNNM
MSKVSPTTANSTELYSPLDQIVCFVVDATHVLCNGTEYDIAEEKLLPTDSLFWIYLGTYVALVLFAGLMAGLTIAILSIDMTSLKVLQAAGTEQNRRYAERIVPMVKRRHLILVTLVLANAASVEAMPIFMDRISDPITAVLVSSTAVLIFGEVLPQAICSRHGLKVGFYLAWLVWALVGLFFVIALPFSHLLDIILGKESGTYYGRKELEALVDIHGPKQKTIEPFRRRKGFASCTKTAADFCNERLTVDEVLIIKGALSMTNKIASTAMVKLQDVFMLSIDTVFDEPCLRLIFELGHSRIPVYEGDRKNIIGVFLTKRLIAIDPNQGISLRQLIDESVTADRKAFYQGLTVDENMHMYELLNRFQTGTMSHMAFVTSKKNAATCAEETIGIVTLEDVIEELLQEEIFDEADIKRDMCECSVAKTVQKMALSYRHKNVIGTKVDAPPMANKAKAARNMSLPLVNMALKKPVIIRNGNLKVDKSVEDSCYTNPQLQLVDECNESDKSDTCSNNNNEDEKTVLDHNSIRDLSALSLNDIANKFAHKEKNEGLESSSL